MERRIRVLYLHHPFVLGGSSVSLLYLLQHLDREVYDPVVACIYEAPQVMDFYESRGFPTIGVPGSMFSHTTAGWWPLNNPLGIARLLQWLVRLPGAAARLRSALREIQPDVVHLNSLTLAPYAPLVRRMGLPVVLHVRESVHPGHFGLRRALLRRLAKRSCDEVVFISEHDRELLTGDSTGEVIYNFVDFQQFDKDLSRSAARDSLGLENSDRVVLYVGGISGIKGIIPLLEALPEVRARVPSLVCLMPGAEFPARRGGLGGILRRAFSAVGWRSAEEERADQLFVAGGLSSYVRLSPFATNIPQMIAAADVVVFPSVEPHFARPVMEAAAMARPVVASDIGGTNEIVEQGVTGLLVPPGDSRALAAALIEVLDGARSAATAMGVEAHRRALSLFDGHRNARRTAAVYERLLDRVPAASTRAE
jgi:glycosyltransferase involved in cell wall biosynthesis